MNIAIKILVIIIFISFGFNVVVAQELEKGMTYDEVENVWGKPKIISTVQYQNSRDDKIERIGYRWKYGTDTTLTFRNEILSYISYPFKGYYKRLKQEKANDTLKDCSLYVFFYDTIQNKYVYTKPGIGKFTLKEFSNYELRAFYKTPNSYQRIDSVRWVVSCDIGGFQETAATWLHFASKTQMIIMKRLKESTFFFYVEKIKLKSGYIIDYPKMENETFIYEGYVNRKWRYVKLKTFEEALKKINKSKYLDKHPMLAYKLIK